MKQTIYPRISFVFACLFSVTSASASGHDGPAATATTDAPRSHRHHHHHHGEGASTSTAPRPPRHRSSSSHAAGSRSSEPATPLPTLSLAPLPGGTPSSSTLPPHSSVAGGLPADLQTLLTSSQSHSRANTPTRAQPAPQRRKPSDPIPAFQPRHSIFQSGFQDWAHKGPLDKTQAYHAGLRGHTHSYDDVLHHLIQAAQKGALPEEQHPAALYHLGYALHTAQRHDFQLTGADIHVVEHLVHLSIGLQTLLADTAVAPDVAQALERIGTHNAFLKGFGETLKTIHQKAGEKPHEK